MSIDAEPCHRKRSFDVAFKDKVIQFAESNSKAAAARVFNINQKYVQTWIKQKEQIVTMVEKQEVKIRKESV